MKKIVSVYYGLIVYDFIVHQLQITEFLVGSVDMILSF